jgi:hypothetical protein
MSKAKDVGEQAARGLANALGCGAPTSTWPSSQLSTRNGHAVSIAESDSGVTSSTSGGIGSPVSGDGVAAESPPLEAAELISALAGVDAEGGGRAVMSGTGAESPGGARRSICAGKKA